MSSFKPIKPGKSKYDPDIKEMPPKENILFDIQYKGKFYPVDTEGIVYFKNQKIHIDVFEKTLKKTKNNKKQLSNKEEGNLLLKELENRVDKQLKLKPKLDELKKKKGISKNNWVNHVREQAKKLGVSYPCALSMPIVSLRWKQLKLKEI